MSDYISSEIFLRDYLVKYALFEKPYQWFDYNDLFMYRFKVPNYRGDINIFQKLCDSLELYCEFLVEENIFEARDFVISKYRTVRQYRLLKYDYEFLPDEILYNLKPKKVTSNKISTPYETSVEVRGIGLDDYEYKTAGFVEKEEKVIIYIYSI
jgi:hypothetical protein